MWRNIFRNTIFSFILFGVTTFGVKNFSISEAAETQNKVELNQNVATSRMTYGRFLEYLEMGWIKQVDLYDNSRNAIVEASSPELGNRPQTIRVEIPVGASQLIQKLKEYNIDFDAHPAENKNLWITVASNVLLPILFVGGLFYFF
jgi:cell division protease FtsH